MHRPRPVFIKEYYHNMIIRSEIKLCKIIRFCPSEKIGKSECKLICEELKTHQSIYYDVPRYTYIGINIHT